MEHVFKLTKSVDVSFGGTVLVSMAQSHILKKKSPLPAFCYVLTGKRSHLVFLGNQGGGVLHMGAKCRKNCVDELGIVSNQEAFEFEVL